MPASTTPARPALPRSPNAWGVSYETLRRWTNQAEVDGGVRDGVPTDIVRENRELKRKNRELEETIEILKAATSFFVRESDPRHR